MDAVEPRRKIHLVPIPRLGGVAIVLAFFAPFVARWLTTGALHLALPNHRVRAAAILLGGLAIALLGVMDDIYGTKARVKLAVQVVVAMALYAAGLRIYVLSIPFAPSIELGAFGLPLTVMWIVGVTNAVNLIDGLDGLAGGVATIAVGSIFMFSLFRAELFTMLISASMGGAVIGFLVYNFNPARIFMGDCGSMFLGFMLAASTLIAGQESPTAVSLVAPAVLLGLPVGDTLLAICRRARARRPIFGADRDHIHHRLLAAGLGHRDAVLVLYGVCLLLGATAQLLWVSDGVHTLALLGCLALLGGLLLRKLTEASRAVPELQSASLRTAPERALVKARVAAARARTRDELWVALRDSARLAGAVSFGVTLRQPGGAAYAAAFAASPSTTVTRTNEGGLDLVVEWPASSKSARFPGQAWIELLTTYVKDAVGRMDDGLEIAGDDLTTAADLVEIAPRS